MLQIYEIILYDRIKIDSFFLKNAIFADLKYSIGTFLLYDSWRKTIVLTPLLQRSWEKYENQKEGIEACLVIRK